MPRTRWAWGVAVAAMGGLSLFGLLTAWTLGRADRSVFGIHALDARWGYVAVSALGLAAIKCHRARAPWLVLMSLTTWGRAVNLVAVGSSTQSRPDELRAAGGWTLIWLLGILAVMVLEAAAVMRATRGHE